MFGFLKKIDWATVGQIAAVSGVTYLTLRAAEQAFPVVQKITSIPAKLIGVLKG